jgi:endoglucanase
LPAKLHLLIEFSRYKNESDLIMYQICNEPHDVSDKVWGRIQQNIINVIRKNDSTHTIIVSPSGWSSYNRLKQLPIYEDDNLIYDFHFYQPMVFTHQQAKFINPPTTSLMDVPFPHDPARMPLFPDDLKGTWFENSFKEYDKIGTVAYLKEQIDIAIEFRSSRNVRIFCGELGVHIPGAPPADRILWYETVCSYLKENNIPFAIWDYKFGFGLFNYPSNNFPDDLNLPLLEAIGFINLTINEAKK